MDAIPKEIDLTYNFKNEMIYLLYVNKLTNQKNITGINLKMYEFFKFNTEEIIQRIQERSKTQHQDLLGDTYLSYYKILPNFTLLKRYLIVLLSI